MMLTRRSLLAKTALVAVSPLIFPQRPSLGAGAAVPPVEHNLPLKDLATTGSIGAGSNQLVLASNPGFRVGDQIIVEIGGESGAGLRGTVGVGGAWPALSYADETEMNANTGQYANITHAWLRSTGNVYIWTGSSWNALETWRWYTQKVFPRALIAVITRISGTTLTLNKTASVATTNANVYFDNAPIIPGSGNNKRNLIAAGMFAMSDTYWLSDSDNFTLQGAGKNLTTLFSPKGVRSQAIRLTNCTNSKVLDLAVLGNARANGFGMFVEAGTDRLIDGGFVNGGVYFRACTDCEARNIKATDVFQKAVGADLSTNVWAYNCDCTMTEALRTYVAWQFQWGDCEGGGAVDCTITCPYLQKGFTTFRSNRISFIRCGGRNCVCSSNSSGNFLFENMDITITANSQFSQLSFHQLEPIININTNISPPNPHVGDGGTIRNPRIVQQGYINAGKYCLRAIVINENNPNVTVKGGYPGSPKPGGYFKAPDYVGASVGSMAIDSTGANTIVDGIRVVGAGRPAPWGNIHLGGGGIVRNCVADLITGGTQTNNQTNAVYIARGGR